MDFILNKAIMIAAGIFISLAIASAVLFVISQIQNIYSQVSTTDISIKKNFNEFDKYNASVLTGVDMLNTAKKYFDSKTVEVKYGDTVLNKTQQQLDKLTNSLESGNSADYGYEYNYDVNYVNNSGYYIITFVKK